jgi:hypothetical protein
MYKDADEFVRTHTLFLDRSFFLKTLSVKS